MTINGEVKEFGRRSFIEENVRNLTINEMKVSFIQGLVNLMTLNLKKNNIIYFNTSKSEKIQECFIERSKEIKL